MGQALVKAFLSSRMVEAEDVYVSDLNADVLKSLSEETGVHTSLDPSEFLEGVDVLFLAVKPQDMMGLLSDIGEHIKDCLLVSVAAGVSTESIEKRVEAGRVIRVMPNMPVLVSEAAAGYCLGESALDDDEAVIQDLFGAVGVCVKVEEELMDAVTGLSGSGPAYVYYFIKALAAGGVKQGLPEETALALATQTVRGAADLLKSEDKSPAELIDEVASPGGTTIEALKVFDEKQMEETIVEAVSAASDKAKNFPWISGNI